VIELVVSNTEDCNHEDDEGADSEGPSRDEGDGLAVEVVANVGVALGVLDAVAAADLALRLALVFSMVANSSAAAVSVLLAVDAVELVRDGLAHVAPAELGGAVGVGLAVAAVGEVACWVVDGAFGHALATVAVVGSAVPVHHTGGPANDSLVKEPVLQRVWVRDRCPHSEGLHACEGRR